MSVLGLSRRQAAASRVRMYAGCATDIDGVLRSELHLALAGCMPIVAVKRREFVHPCSKHIDALDQAASAAAFS